MSLHKNKLSLAALSVIFALQGCSGTTTKITESDILNAERSGTLQTLYQEIQNGTGRGKSLSPQDKSAYLSKIGGRLASQSAQAINVAINQARLESKIVPLSVLDSQTTRAQVMRGWDKAQYDNIIAVIGEEMAETQKAIAVKQGVMESVSIEQLDKKHGLFVELKTLYGDANANGLAQMQTQMFSDSYDLVDNYIANKDYQNAIARLQTLVALAPEFRDVTAKLEDLQSTALQSSFIDYVGNGEVEKARELLELLYNGEYFAQQKGVIMPPAMDLANYYVAVAMDHTGNENLSEAYRLFNEARAIKAMFGVQYSEVTEEADFIDFIYALYEQAKNQNVDGLALGYLKVIEQMRPNFPELENLLRDATEKVMDDAVYKVTTTAFDGDGAHKTLGRSVSSKVTKYVFETLPKDVRMVERDQLDAVLKEQQINDLKSGSGIDLDSADILIQGTILQADVETTEHPSSRKIRAVTERREVSNPDYATWMALSSSDKAKVPQPSRTITKEIKEDIDIKLTHVSKVAVMSVSYRLVDASSADVIHADSVNDKRKVADETTEGVKIGIFESPFKVADLPSDSELLAELSQKLSHEIGNQVVDILKDSEKSYEKDALKLYNERNFVGATEALAKAFVMTQAKALPQEALEQTLRQYAVTTRLEN